MSKRIGTDNSRAGISMRIVSRFIVTASILMALAACGKSGDAAQGAAAGAEQALAFSEVAWTDLLPPEDLDAILNPPDYLADIEDGSPEDQIDSQLSNSTVPAGEDRYQQALVSTRVIDEMDGKPVRIPGFIVPLEFDDQQMVTEFFLVPFFGACIHVPPPPPNQIIFVSYPQGFQLSALTDPFWISGVLETSMTENAMATAAYAMQMQQFEPYTN